MAAPRKATNMAQNLVMTTVTSNSFYGMTGSTTTIPQHIYTPQQIVTDTHVGRVATHVNQPLGVHKIKPDYNTTANTYNFIGSHVQQHRVVVDHKIEDIVPQKHKDKFSIRNIFKKRS